MSETEEAAKTRICCGAPQTVNGREPLLHCLGSLCMAWRWHEPWTRRGYCGLAGNPSQSAA